MNKNHKCEYDTDGGECRVCGKTVAEWAKTPTDPTIEAISRLSNRILIKVLEQLPKNIDDWTADDKLVAQNLVEQFLTQFVKDGKNKCKYI